MKIDPQGERRLLKRLRHRRSSLELIEILLRSNRPLYYNTYSVSLVPSSPLGWVSNQAISWWMIFLNIASLILWTCLSAVRPQSPNPSQANARFRKANAMYHQATSVMLDSRSTGFVQLLRRHWTKSTKSSTTEFMRRNCAGVRTP